MPACSNIRLPLDNTSVATSFPTALLNTPFNLSIGIISERPTPAPNIEAFALSDSVAPASLARSLASPAPAPIANPYPSLGLIIEAPRIPPKEPNASPNLRGIAPYPSASIEACILASGARAS